VQEVREAILCTKKCPGNEGLPYEFPYTGPYKLAMVDYYEAMCNTRKIFGITFFKITFTYKNSQILF